MLSRVEGTYAAGAGLVSTLLAGTMYDPGSMEALATA